MSVSRLQDLAETDPAAWPEADCMDLLQEAIRSRASESALLAERERLRERIKDDNAVCLCGCPDEDHETVGGPDEGVQCEKHVEDDERPCLYVCVAVRDLYLARLAERDALRALCEQMENVLVTVVERDLRPVSCGGIDNYLDLGWVNQKWVDDARAALAAAREAGIGKKEESDVRRNG